MQVIFPLITLYGRYTQTVQHSNFCVIQHQLHDIHFVYAHNLTSRLIYITNLAEATESSWIEACIVSMNYEC